VTSQKIPAAELAPRKRGRPSKPNAATDAERQALSRDRRERRAAQTLMLIASMDALLRDEDRARLDSIPTFRAKLDEARQFARAFRMTTLDRPP